MLRRGLTPAAVILASLAGLAPALGDEDMRTAAQYLQGLRDRGYFELADEYLELLRIAPGTPADVRETIDFEQGRNMIDEASRTGDLGLQKELLDKARGKLVAFTKAHPKNPKAPEALVQLARLLVERGHLAMIMRGETADPKEKAAKLAEARDSFDQARAAYDQADQALSAAFKAFPPFLPDNDPRKAERDRTHTAMMEAQIQKAVVDYEQGQTYPAGSPQRNDYLAKGLTTFEGLYKRYRTQLAGLTARMYQAKCYEERGEIGPALGIYNELLEHPAPQLRGMQRIVAYFKIIAHAKRKEYALAADLASNWLQKYNTPNEQRTIEGLGVQLELAKNILAQFPEASGKEREVATARVVEVLSRVVRIPSPHKAEALEILKKYKPKAATVAENLGRMTYDELMAQAEEGISSEEWDKAIAALRLAILKADPAKDPDKANLARYELGFCYYRTKRPYEADVLMEHLARRYPRHSTAPKASTVAMASLADAYNTFVEIDRQSDLNRLVAVARYTVETWPDKDEGDSARMNLGMIYHGLGQYAKAIETYGSVKPKSARWAEAQTKLGASHWEQSRALRRKADDKGADAEQAKALASLNGALKSRREAGAAATDTELVGNLCDIAEIQLEIGKPAAALELLEPTARAVQGVGTTTPASARLLALLLRAHINNGQVENALGDMALLEKLGGGENLTQLYLNLGRLLEKEMKALEDKNDRAGLARRKADYLKFLTALAGAKSGQTYDSLEWAGEQMLKIQKPKDAAVLFSRILETVGKDKAFLAQPGANDRLLRTRLRYSEALRGQDQFAAAEELVGKLLQEYPREIGTLFEQGMLLEDKAEATARADAKQAAWKAAFAHWQKLALALGAGRTRRVEYYDAWYHAAYALYKEGQPTKAKQTLGSVMRLSPKVGGPEMKAKYDALLKQIK